MIKYYFEYLKKDGRSDSVIQSALRTVEEFCQFYLGRKNATANHALLFDLDTFIEYIEKGENAKYIKTYKQASTALNRLPDC